VAATVCDIRFLKSTFYDANISPVYGANPNGTEVTAALFQVPGPKSTVNTISSCPA